MADDDGWIRVGSDEHRALERRRARRRLQRIPEPITVAEAIRRGRLAPNRAVTLTGTITGLADRRTIENAPWAIIEITDETGSIEVLIFPRAYSRTSSETLHLGAHVQILGDVKDRPDEVPEVVAREVF